MSAKERKSEKGRIKGIKDKAEINRDSKEETSAGKEGVGTIRIKERREQKGRNKKGDKQVEENGKEKGQDEKIRDKGERTEGEEREKEREGREQRLMM